MNVPISGPLLLGKARDFAFLPNFPEFSPGTGWLHRIKKRHGIAYNSIAREAASVDIKRAEQWLVDNLHEIYSYRVPERVHTACTSPGGILDCFLSWDKQSWSARSIERTSRQQVHPEPSDECRVVPEQVPEPSITARYGQGAHSCWRCDYLIGSTPVRNSGRRQILSHRLQGSARLAWVPQCYGSNGNQRRAEELRKRFLLRLASPAARPIAPAQPGCGSPPASDPIVPAQL
ncbi:hypothetical protein ISCGN_019801 [Ixodes scapularis]